MTEKAAWALARDKELDMVVLNPAVVLGPKVTSTTQSILTYLTGLYSFPELRPICLMHSQIDDFVL